MIEVGATVVDYEGDKGVVTDYSGGYITVLMENGDEYVYSDDDHDLTVTEQ